MKHTGEIWKEAHEKENLCSSIPIIYILSFYLFINFWPYHIAYAILVPQSETEPRHIAVKAWSPNHWTIREFPHLYFRSLNSGDFPGGQVVKILHFHCRGPRFDSWSGN